MINIEYMYDVGGLYLLNSVRAKTGFRFCSSAKNDFDLTKSFSLLLKRYVDVFSITFLSTFLHLRILKKTPLILLPSLPNFFPQVPFRFPKENFHPSP